MDQVQYVYLCSGGARCDSQFRAEGQKLAVPSLDEADGLEGGSCWYLNSSTQRISSRQERSLAIRSFRADVTVNVIDPGDVSGRIRNTVEPLGGYYLDVGF